MCVTVCVQVSIGFAGPAAEDFPSLAPIAVMWSYLLNGADAPLPAGLTGLCANANTLTLELPTSSHCLRLEHVPADRLTDAWLCVSALLRELADDGIDPVRMARVIACEAAKASYALETRTHSVVVAAVVPSFCHSFQLRASGSCGNFSSNSSISDGLPPHEPEWELSDSWEQLSRELVQHPLARSTNTQPSEAGGAALGADECVCVPDLCGRLDVVARLRRLPCDPSYWSGILRKWFIDTPTVVVRPRVCVCVLSLLDEGMCLCVWWHVYVSVSVCLMHVCE